MIHNKLQPDKHLLDCLYFTCVSGHDLWSDDIEPPPEKPKPLWYVMKLDLVRLARLAGLRAVRYKIVGIQDKY